jgi:hypothetical protein
LTGCRQISKQITLYEYLSCVYGESTNLKTQKFPYISTPWSLSPATSTALVNICNSRIGSTPYICVSSMILTTGIHYFPVHHLRTGLSNGSTKRSLWGTN